MAFRGYEGPAGTGKTHCLIEAVEQHVAARPLLEHQRVLALTFMHGSRRRLESRLSNIRSLAGRYACLTIDGFAEWLVKRWCTLACALETGPVGFDQTCACGANLLESPIVARWVTATYPVIVVDEAQELSPPRLRLIRALELHAEMFVAADEFQCLDEALDTSPFQEWFASGKITYLREPRRTSRPGLLAAAEALRSGQAPARKSAGLAIKYEFKHQMPFAIGHALHRAHHQGSVAVVVAPGERSWVDPLLSRLRSGFRSKAQVIHPLQIAWEASLSLETERVLANLGGGDAIAAEAAIALLTTIEDPPAWLPRVLAGIKHQLSVCNQGMWSLEELKTLVERKAAQHRAHCFVRSVGIPVMTVHGAKNREFQHVVVLWPHGVRADAQYQIRLLYNAITRARETCTVFVRGQDLLTAAPFT